MDDRRRRLRRPEARELALGGERQAADACAPVAGRLPDEEELGGARPFEIAGEAPVEAAACRVLVERGSDSGPREGRRERGPAQEADCRLDRSTYPACRSRPAPRRAPRRLRPKRRRPRDHRRLDPARRDRAAQRRRGRLRGGRARLGRVLPVRQRPWRCSRAQDPLPLSSTTPTTRPRPSARPGSSSRTTRSSRSSKRRDRARARGAPVPEPVERSAALRRQRALRAGARAQAVQVDDGLSPALRRRGVRSTGGTSSGHGRGATSPSCTRTRSTAQDMFAGLKRGLGTLSSRIDARADVRALGH